MRQVKSVTTALTSFNFLNDVRSRVSHFHLNPFNCLHTMIQSGKYRVRIGLLDTYSGKPAIKLPIKGRTEYNWHELGEIDIEEWKLQ